MRLLILLSFVFSLASVQTQCPPAPDCDPSTCQPPDCVCAGSQPNIPLEDRPMIIYLTFDDAMTEVFDNSYYSELFGGNYVNPNGCPIRATYYVTHEYNDYSVSQKYYALGHEIASHSVTHLTNTTYWQTLDTEGWRAEMGEMKKMLNKYGNIALDDIIGTRAPFLQGGGDNQFAMMEDEGFEYDCTMPSITYGYTNLDNGRWPYTLDYKDTTDCEIPPCPKCSYNGIWNQPILSLEDNWYGCCGSPDTGAPCDMLDGCIIISGNDPEDVFEMMFKNFWRAYTGETRAPFGYYMHAAWFSGTPWHFDGYKMFLANVTQYDDVWIVPVQAGLEYAKTPMTNDQLVNGEFQPFNCDPADFPVYDCTPTSCKYDNVTINGQVMFQIYMKTCSEPCPPEYPWLGNWEGNEVPHDLY